MNNKTLLTGLLCAGLVSGTLHAIGQTVFPLEEIFEIAETQSIRLRPVFTAQEEAEKDISVAKSGRLPEIMAEVAVSYFGDGFTTKRNFSDYQVAPIPHLGTSFAVNINQPVYTGGAISSSIKLAELKSTASRFATDLKRDNIRFQITGVYLDLYKFTNLRSVVISNIEAAQKVLTEMRARYEQGIILSTDITRYELLVENLKLSLTKIDNMLTILNHNLVTISGLPQNTVVSPDTTILSRSLPLHDEKWWKQEAEICSPTLHLASNAIEINKAAENLARAERLPKIGIYAGWSLNGPILVEVPPINRNLSYWNIGVGLSYNISSLYKSNKSIAKSRLSTLKAKEELEETLETINLNLQTDHIHYLESYEDLKTRTKSVELADRNYRIVSTRYSEGMALITDLLDAANSKLEAEQQLVNARIDIIYYYYKLLFTSGKI